MAALTPSEASVKDVEAHSDFNDDEQPQSIMAIDKETDAGLANGAQDKDHAVMRTSTKSSWRDPGPPPDGGWKGWTQVALGHLVIMNTWGFVNSYGVFQTYYVTELNRPPSDISWVGSMQVFLLFFIGTFTGRMTDAGYFRQVFAVGSVLYAIGIFMVSLCTSYWQVFLAQGVCMGLGMGCLFCPSLSVLSTYFSTKRSLAIGIGAAGSGTGGMVFPAMVQQLLPRVGFPWTIRAVAFIQVTALIICNIGIKPRTVPRRTGALVDWMSFKELPYVFFAVGMFFNFWGVYFAFYYLGSYARNILHVNVDESINLLITLNGVGILGRILPNHLADRYYGPLNTLIPVVLVASVIIYSWIAVTNRGGLYAWAVMYGIFGAAIQSLFPATLASLTTDLRKAGVRMGMIFVSQTLQNTIVSFAVLTGPPITGQLIQKKNGGFLYAQLFGGSVLLVGSGFLTASRLAKSRKLWVKL
ncbi:transporter MCH4-like protein 6 [Phlyctema vagabunda]|uniref:Transporter MCH4-like protein 6 n=1 Tax=Phlyctema vagabunda TaxID=108571 RepID=A0ABR4PJ28_9HELO